MLYDFHPEAPIWLQEDVTLQFLFGTTKKDFRVSGLMKRFSSGVQIGLYEVMSGISQIFAGQTTKNILCLDQLIIFVSFGLLKRVKFYKGLSTTKIMFRVFP